MSAQQEFAHGPMQKADVHHSDVCQIAAKVTEKESDLAHGMHLVVCKVQANMEYSKPYTDVAPTEHS